MDDLVSEDEARFAVFFEKYNNLAETTIEQGGSVTPEYEDRTLSYTSLRSAISFAEWKEKSAFSGVSEDSKTCTELTEHPDVDIIIFSRDGKPTTHPIFMCSHTVGTDMLIVPQMLLAEMGGVTDCHDLSNARNDTKVEHDSGEENRRQTGEKAQERNASSQNNGLVIHVPDPALNALEVVQREMGSNAEDLSATNRQVLTLQIALKSLKEQMSTLANSHAKEIEILEEKRLQEREVAAKTMTELERTNMYLRSRLGGREKYGRGDTHSSTVARKDADWSDSHWRTPGIWECDREGESQLPVWEHDSTEFVPWPLETIVIHSHQNTHS